MDKKPVRAIKYGVKVWMNKDMDDLRKTECLCLHCDHMGRCSTATRGYHLCKDDNISFLVTRCPRWRLK